MSSSSIKFDDDAGNMDIGLLIFLCRFRLLSSLVVVNFLVVVLNVVGAVVVVLVCVVEVVVEGMVGLDVEVYFKLCLY